MIAQTEVAEIICISRSGPPFLCCCHETVHAVVQAACRGQCAISCLSCSLPAELSCNGNDWTYPLLQTELHHACGAALGLGLPVMLAPDLKAAL